MQFYTSKPGLAEFVEHQNSYLRATGFESHCEQEFFILHFCRFRRAPGRLTGAIQMKSRMTSIRGA